MIPDKIREPTDPAKLAKFLVRDYAIATKYRVEGLKMQAGAGFIDLLNGESLEERVVRRASLYIWECLPENDRPFRYAVFSVVKLLLTWFMSEGTFR